MNFFDPVQMAAKIADIFFQAKMKKFYLVLDCLLTVVLPEFAKVATVEFFMDFWELLNNIFSLFYIKY